MEQLLETNESKTRMSHIVVKNEIRFDSQSFVQTTPKYFNIEIFF